MSQPETMYYSVSHGDEDPMVRRRRLEAEAREKAKKEAEESKRPELPVHLL